jgi:hypothetical protein
VGRLNYNTSRLVHALPEEALDFLIALGLNFVFVALVALLLLPLGKTPLALRLVKGYGVFWIVTVLTALVLYRLQKLFRVGTDEHYDAFLISNLSHGVVLLAGWSAFAALAVRGFVGGVPLWVAAIMWLVGVLSSYVAFIVLSAFYTASVYKVVNAVAALVSFLVFALWPAGARATFGWFFNLF